MQRVKSIVFGLNFMCVQNFFSVCPTLTPFALQYSDYSVRLEQFFKRVRSGYQNEQPLHIADPTRSGFKIVPFAIFQSMSVQQLHRLHRDRTVIVTGCPIPDLKFDEAGLRMLAPLGSQVSLQGKILLLLLDKTVKKF